MDRFACRRKWRRICAAISGGRNWLRFLEANGFCGILADEMGWVMTLKRWSGCAAQRSILGAGQAGADRLSLHLVENWAV
jgi:hypothetical protein